MKIQAMTDTGLVRGNNEDAFWFDNGLQAIAVADGMGGQNGGEVASRLAVKNFATWCERILPHRSTATLFSTVYSAIIPAINKLVTQVSRNDNGLHGMGTTLVGTVFHEDCLHVTHIGDSRVAFISTIDKSLKWLTKDDNVAELMVVQGKLTPEQARRSHYRHILTACIGGREASNSTDVHYQQLAWPRGCLLLLCTDGLLDNTEDHEIVDCCINVLPGNLAAACSNLVELANSNGGRDNCTVVLASRD